MSKKDFQEGWEKGLSLFIYEILKEELCSTISNCDSSTYLGKMGVWTNSLHQKVIMQFTEMASCVAKASLQHVDHMELVGGIGRCQCGGVKVLRINWKNVSDKPSFFWGCGRYRVFEKYQHDRATPFRSATIQNVLENPNLVTKIPSKDLQHIMDTMDNNQQAILELDSET